MPFLSQPNFLRHTKKMAAAPTVLRAKPPMHNCSGQVYGAADGAEITSR